GRLASLLLGGLLLGLVGPGCQTNPPLTAVADRQPLYSVGPNGTVTRLPDSGSGIELAQYQYSSRFGPGQDPFRPAPAQPAQFARQPEVGPEPRKLPMPRELPPQEDKDKEKDKKDKEEQPLTVPTLLPPEPPAPPPLPI